MSDGRMATSNSSVVLSGLPPWAAVAALILLIAGAILIICGARGDLWLDEIWSLVLLQPVKSFGGIIWDINHDNNHVLNSMYLYVIGPDASPIALRGLSIVFGIASIAAAGLVLLGNGVIPALAAMLLFAVSYPAIHFASEARGYAGLILFSLLSLVFLQREFRQPSLINRQAFGLCIGLGVLSHLSMLFGAVAFGLWTLWVTWRRSGNLRKTVIDSLVTLLPAICWATVIFVTVGWNALRYGFVVNVRSVPNQFAVGGINPFTFDGYINAYGKLIGWLIGIPDSVPAWLCLAGAAVLIAAAGYVWRGRADPRYSLYVISVVVLPACALAAQPDNSNIARYFLFSGVMFLLFVADLASFALQKTGPIRVIAAAAVLAIIAGNAVSLSHFYSDGRGHYAQAVAEMAKGGGRVLYGSDHNFRTPTVVDYYGKRLGVETDYLFSSSWCVVRPDWMIIENPNNDILNYSQPVVNAGRCALKFNRVAVYPFWGLSGRQWVLFRRVN